MKLKQSKRSVELVLNTFCSGLVVVLSFLTIALLEIAMLGSATAQAQSISTVADNDLPILQRGFTVHFNENVGIANIQFSIDKAIDRNISFGFRTENPMRNVERAIPGEDYKSKSGTVTIPAGRKVAEIGIEIINDNKVEHPAEVFIIKLFDPENVVLPSISLMNVYIVDDDGNVPVILIKNTYARESSGSVDFVVTRVGNVNLRSIVRFSTSEDTVTINNKRAKANVDFVPIQGALTFSIGQTTKTIKVGIIDDKEIEESETFRLTLQNLRYDSRAGRRDGRLIRQGVLGIIVDDEEPPIVSIVAPEAVDEGDSGETDMVFQVSMSATSGQEVEVDYAVNDSSTAESGVDFRALMAGTLTFAASASDAALTQAIKVSVIGDELVENDETVIVALSNPVNATIDDGSATATGIIKNDDGLPARGSMTMSVTVTPTELTVEEGETRTYTVKLNTKPTGSVTVTPSSGDAEVATVSGALTFTTGDWNTAQTVTVSGVDNNVASGNGNTTVNHAVTGYGSVSSAAPVSVTVTDNDTDGVTVAPQALTVAEGETGTYTVKLNTKPAGSVTVTPSSGDAEVATVSTLNHDWNTRR